MMGKLTAYIIGAALVSISFMTTPASAGWKEDCAAAIQKVELRLASNAGQKGRIHVRQFIDKAIEKLAKGKKKGCANQVKKAHAKMDKKGWN